MIGALVGRGGLLGQTLDICRAQKKKTNDKQSLSCAITERAAKIPICHLFFQKHTAKALFAV
jgi:hypothetical protein